MIQLVTDDTPTKPPAPLEVTLPKNGELAVTGRHLVLAYLQANGAPHRVVWDLELMVGEGLSNVERHARTATDCTIRCMTVEGLATATLEYDSRRFETRRAMPDLSHPAFYKECGRGIPMMRAAAEEDGGGCAVWDFRALQPGRTDPDAPFRVTVTLTKLWAMRVEEGQIAA